MDFNKVLDTLFREMDEQLKPKLTVEASAFLGPTMMPEAPIATHDCPLHRGVILEKISARGRNYVKCREKNCPIWLPWDQYLSHVLSEVKEKMHATDQQKYFCFCRKACKVELVKEANSRFRGCCYLSCAQLKCDSAKWIVETPGRNVFKGTLSC